MISDDTKEKANPSNPSVENDGATIDHTINDAQSLPFKSYAEYTKWRNRRNATNLPSQRDILAAIVFDESKSTQRVLKLTSPKDFDYRYADDWKESPATYERIATVAFRYWEANDRPPGHAIIDALMKDDEQALACVRRLEATWGEKALGEERPEWSPTSGLKVQEQQKELRPIWERPIIYNEAKEEAEVHGRDWIKSLVEDVREWKADLEWRDQAERQQLERQEEKQKPQRRRDQIRALAQEGKTQTEIAAQLRISQPAVSNHLRKLQRNRHRS